MIIHLHPQMRLTAVKPVIIKSGDALTIDGDVVDLSVIPDGAELSASAISNEWFAGVIRRDAGVLHVSLRLPHGPDASEAMCFPADIVDPPDGEIVLPSDPEPPPSYSPPEPEEEPINGDD